MDEQIFENLFVLSVFTLLTTLKLHSSSLIQAVARIRSKRFRHPDDAFFLENKMESLMVYCLRWIKPDSVFGKMILKIFILIYLLEYYFL